MLLLDLTYFNRTAPNGEPPQPAYSGSVAGRAADSRSHSGEAARRTARPAAAEAGLQGDISALRRFAGPTARRRSHGARGRHPGRSPRRGIGRRSRPDPARLGNGRLGAFAQQRRVMRAQRRVAAVTGRAAIFRRWLSAHALVLQVCGGHRSRNLRNRACHIRQSSHPRWLRASWPAPHLRPHRSSPCRPWGYGSNRPVRDGSALP